MKYLAMSDLWRLDQMRQKFKETSGTAQVRTTEQSRVLGHIKQIFPLAVFPDDLIIEELRIVHIKKTGPWMNQVISIMATDIACVNTSTGILFGELHVRSLTGGPEIYLDHIARGDVVAARSLIEGIALASREGLIIEEQRNLEAERQNFIAAGEIHYG